MFFCKYWGISKNSFIYRAHTAASSLVSRLVVQWCNTKKVFRKSLPSSQGNTYDGVYSNLLKTRMLWILWNVLKQLFRMSRLNDCFYNLFKPINRPQKCSNPETEGILICWDSSRLCYCENRSKGFLACSFAMTFIMTKMIYFLVWSCL